MTEKSNPLALGALIEAKPNGLADRSFSENRATGPKTPTGKRRASLNSLKSGLYSTTLLIRGESEAEYLAFARAIVASLDVHTPLEMACAERIVAGLWRSRRARRFETAHLDRAAESVEKLRAALDAIERELEKCRKESEAVASLLYPKASSSDKLDAAIEGTLRVAKVYLPNTWREVEEALPYAVRERVSKKHVLALRESARTALSPIFKKAPDTDSLVSWLLGALHDCEQKLLKELDNAAAEYAAAYPNVFVLPQEGEGWGFGDVRFQKSGPGKALDDAERRLDRQVSRAIADLEAARRLRPSG